MKLFSRLYLLLVLSIIGFGWGIEQIWQNMEESNESAWEHRVIFSLANQLLAKSESPDSEGNRVENKDIDTKEVFPNTHSLLTTTIKDAYGDNDIEFLRSDEATIQHIHALLADNQIHYFDDAGLTYVFKQADISGWIIRMRIPNNYHQNSSSQWVFILGFYVILAIIIFIWMYPIARDLEKLNVSFQSFGDTINVPSIRLSRFTQLQFVADEFEKMASQIKQLMGFQSDMANGIAHELRTPLSRTQFSLNECRESFEQLSLQNETLFQPSQYNELGRRVDRNHSVNVTFDQPIKEQLKHIHDIQLNLNEMGDLITQILNFATISSIEKNIVQESGDMCSLLDDVVNRLSSQKPENIAINLSCGSAVAHCHEYLMKTLMENLVTNAFRFARTSIDIHFTVGVHEFQLDVEDDGEGLASEDIEHIFKRFYKSKKNSKRSGFGLGLSLVKRIAELHHGSVWASQSKKGGAKISVQWPKR